jgi:endonuclease G
MFVNEDVVRETEQRIAAKGIELSDLSGGGGQVEIDLHEIARAPTVEDIGSAYGIGHRLRIPLRGLVRPPRTAAPTAGEVENRLRHASFAGAVPSKAEYERAIGANDLVDENYLERALAAAQPVCRLVFRDIETNRQAFATGFMISPQLMLTNWHVFPRREAANGALAEFNYKLDIKGLAVTPVRFQVRPDIFFASDKVLDYAVVGIAATSTDGVAQLSSFGYHRLVQETGKLAKNEPITLIQHPDGGYRQIALRENQLMDEPKPADLFLLYRSDTAQGSSGSPAFNDSWQIVALHHSGKARQVSGDYILRNGDRVPSLKGVPDALVDWIANEGVRASVLCRALRDGISSSAIRDELVAAMEGGGDVMTRSIGTQEAMSMTRRGGPVSVSPVPVLPSGLFAGLSSLELNATQINLAQQITVQTPSSQATYVPARVDVRVPADDQTLAEKLVTPVIDRKYSNRKGYVDTFIGVRVPVPTVTDKSIVSKTDDGAHVIPYQHFSAVINKKRRLALFTASNVDASAKARKPKLDADYTRKGLTGLGKDDLEQWFTDPRIPEEHQLPDVFYTKDRQAFDKGHIVRRDDVCWGRTYAQLRRANGDTFHTTNCSPQVMDFNRSNKGGKWGELENMILKQAKTEKLAIFAGPVFDDDDDVFEGVDERGPVSVQIPRRYWKIVFAKASGGLEAFAFILEQDLSDVALEPEFAVGAEWVPHMISIPKLEDMLTGLTFDQVIHHADQFGAQHGDELALAAEIKME